MNLRENLGVRLTLLSLALSGCASQDYVKQEVGGVNARFEAIQSQLKELGQRVDGNSVRLNHFENRLSQDEQAAASLKQRGDENLAALAASTQRLDALDTGLAAANNGLRANAADVVHAQQRLDAVEAHAARLDVAVSSMQVAATTVQTTPIAAAPVSVAPIVAPAVAPAAAPATPPVTAMADATGIRIDDLIAQIATANERIAANSSGIDAVASRVAGQDAVINTVAKRVDTMSARLDGNDTRLAVSGEHLALLQASVKEQGSRIEQNEKALAEASGVSATAREALERAIRAGHLAEGKLVYETVLSEDLANFDLQQASLSENSRKALIAFANKLKAEHQGVYIEIQGHTDATGSAAGNQLLGLARAETVRDFLHNHGGIALNRLSVISYGQSKPVADNTTRVGRMKNRRVVLEVLK